METQFGIRQLLAQHPIVPVVNISSIAEIENIINSLLSQSIHCIEITLRSEVAFKAIEEAIALSPGYFHIGVGTIVSEEQIEKCVHLGVDFMVSPGTSKSTAQALDDAGIPFLPGVMTPSEIIQGLNRSWDTFKLFPFNIAGGDVALKNYSKAFQNVKFCPTGGINEKNHQKILALDNVISVGGSWVLNK